MPALAPVMIAILLFTRNSPFSISPHPPRRLALWHKIKMTMTIQEVAARFDELAQKEQWFEIQDELFAADVKSIEPPHSRYMAYAEGKTAVRQKAEAFVGKIKGVHGATTTPPTIAANHFSVGRRVDITVDGFGRITIDQIMLYEVRNGQIVSEQFFY